MIRRTNLTRKTPLATGKPLQRKTGLRPQSAKRRKQDRESRSALAQFAEEFPKCWLCNRCPWPGVQTHHIAGRKCPERHDRRNLARLCQKCHDAAHDGLLTLTSVLALKKLHDPDFYCREFVLEMRGYAASHIEESEVDAAVECLR